LSIYDPLAKGKIIKYHFVMDTEDSQNCVPKQQKHLCLLPVSLFILKVPGTASSFSFQYLKVTGHTVNSIIYTLVYHLQNLKDSSILRGHRRCFVFFSIDGFDGNHLCHRICIYFNDSQNIWVKRATSWWQKLKTKLAFLVWNPRGEYTNQKPMFRFI